MTLVIVWNNDGARYVCSEATLSDALRAAKAARTPRNRVVTILWWGELSHRWTRTAERPHLKNHWVRR